MFLKCRAGDGSSLSWVVEHQIQPFDELLLSGRLEQIVTQSLGVSVSVPATSGRAVSVRYCKGTLTRGATPAYQDVPSLCMEGRTVCAQLVADLEVSCGGEGAPWKACRRVRLGSVPVMIGCAWMPIPPHAAEDDMGGYFVINGRDVVVPALERTAQNRVMVVRPAGLQGGADSKEERAAMVYSTSLGPGQRTSAALRLTLMRDGRVRAASEGRMQSLPVVVLLRQLGMRDRGACERACERWGLHRPDWDLLDPSFDEADQPAWAHRDQEQESQSVGEWLLPHVGPEPGDKASFVCHMLRLGGRCPPRTPPPGMPGMPGMTCNSLRLTRSLIYDVLVQRVAADCGA